MENGIYAKFNTAKGTILAKLEHELAPGTVGNFVALAEGNMKNKAKAAGEKYYDGLNFHRVIANFMIQSGCPNGNGYGDPGYKFDDEFHPSLKHDRPGVLSMANSSDPGTNGSQFFITHGPTSHLDNKHSVFGYVIEGQDVVDAIVQGDVIKTVEILRVGDEAEKWDAIQAFINLKEGKMERLAAGFEKTESGLRYKFIQRGSGKKAEPGKTVSVHYEGSLENGKVFDSSYPRKQPIEFRLGQGQVIEGWDEGIALLQVGDKARFVIPSDLAYGPRGAGGAIPPNATLIFDVELMEVK